MADATEPVLLRRDADGICFLALNRPAARNALNAELFLALDREIAALAAEPDTTGVVVLSGSGSCFSAGNDIGSLGHASKLPSPHFQAEVLERIEALPQVVVAAVHGYCMTGALELVLACDLIVAADTARFRDTHGQLGLLPHWGMTQRLPRMVGLQQARRMMYSGQPVTGEQAVGMGLAVSCVPEAQLAEAAETLARQIAQNSFWTLRHEKRQMLDGHNLPYTRALRREREESPGRSPDFADRLKAVKARLARPAA